MIRRRQPRGRVQGLGIVEEFLRAGQRRLELLHGAAVQQELHKVVEPARIGRPHQDLLIDLRHLDNPELQTAGDAGEHLLPRSQPRVQQTAPEGQPGRIDAAAEHVKVNLGHETDQLGRRPFFARHDHEECRGRL